MEKQKKQLLGLLVILIVAVIAFIVVKNLPQEEETDTTASYEVTNLNADDVTKLVYTNENGTLTLNKDGETGSVMKIAV